MKLLNSQRIMAMMTVMSVCSLLVANALTHNTPPRCVTPSSDYINSATSISTSIESLSNRRMFFQKAAFASAGSIPVFAGANMVEPSLALDMEAFANSQLAADSKSSPPTTKKITATATSTPRVSSGDSKQMAEDEGMCKFGQASQAKGEACVRAGLPTKAKYEGGVDAFGKVDRGDFVRCTSYYELINGKYEKFTKCN